MPKIKVVVLLVQQLRHGFTNKAKVSPNLTVAHMGIVVKHKIKIDTLFTLIPRKGMTNNGKTGLVVAIAR